MNRKGVSYDVGRVYYYNWRPLFDPKVVHRELEIIKEDLHCNAVRICGFGIGRLMAAAEDALRQGLEVWLSPEMWDKSEKETIKYVVEAAAAAERLRQQWPERLVFSLGSESTLFMQGIVEGRNLQQRLGNPNLWQKVKAGEHNKPLNAFLARASQEVRQVFHGKVTYASLIWEAVDWSLFDLIGVDHYRITRIKDRYIEMLKPLFAFGKPVIITEFGYCTYQGAEDVGGRGWDIVDNRTLFLHQMPLLGRFVRPRLKGNHVRDEGLQARELIDQLGALDNADVDGAFIMTFISPLSTYDDNPRYDLDMASYSLVKSYSKGRYGKTYPDMPWEPKESFRAVADYYAKH